MENALQALDLDQSIYHFTFCFGYVLLLCIQNFEFLSVYQPTSLYQTEISQQQWDGLTLLVPRG